MFRGYYTAASGIVTQEKMLNVYSGNLSNVRTVGYKRHNLITGTFGEHIAVRMNAYQGARTPEIGRGVYMQTTTGEYTDHEQGGFEYTGRPMDLAIAGDGYFLITDEEGNEMLTRDGQFSLDPDGYLVLPGYGRVQGEGGDIDIGTAEFIIDPDGNIYLSAVEEGEESVLIDRLMVVIPEEGADMKKNAQGMFISANFAQAGLDVDMSLMQGTLERSNVNVAEEMTRIMSSQRSLQSCSQIVKMYDQMAEQSATRISKVQ